MKTIKITYRLDDIDKVANKILNTVVSKTVVFYGEIGAGKTTLIKALIKALQSNDNATSPTFSIINEYELPNDKAFHLDLYRIKSLDEAYDFGIEDYLYTGHWLFVEWPEHIVPLLQSQFDCIEITTFEDNQRTLIFTTNTNNLKEINAVKQVE